MKCDGIDCLHCTLPASMCRGAQHNHKTPHNGTQPTRKTGKPDKTAVRYASLPGIRKNYPFCTWSDGKDIYD